MSTTELGTLRASARRRAIYVQCLIDDAAALWHDTYPTSGDSPADRRSRRFTGLYQAFQALAAEHLRSSRENVDRFTVEQAAAHLDQFLAGSPTSGVSPTAEIRCAVALLRDALDAAGADNIGS